MLRFALAGALALLTTIAPLSAQRPPSTVEPVTGTAFGKWDLPGKEPGRFRGLMIQDDKRRFVIEGRLEMVPMPEGRGGRLDGVLVPITTDGIARPPVAGVQGTFLVRPGRYGTFEAVIYEISPAAGVRAEPIGKIAGRFADPLSRNGEDPTGRFQARWALQR